MVHTCVHSSVHVQHARLCSVAGQHPTTRAGFPTVGLGSAKRGSNGQATTGGNREDLDSRELPVESTKAGLDAMAHLSQGQAR
jgi:hypothetical protein